MPAEENAYRISENPCAPGLARLESPCGSITATAVPDSTMSGGTRITIEAIFISNASIFLPRYSGVRPIMRPAMKTAMIANTSIP